MQSIILSASILAADFAHLAADVHAVLAAGVDYIHFDVMDHHFVPNLSFGSVVCSALRKAGITAPIDVHLMVEDPEYYIKPFAAAGANLVTFHPETVSNVQHCIDNIRQHGMKVGLALNPERSLDSVEEFLEQIDLLLIMSVNPGFGGQSFIVASLDKIRAAKHLLQTINHPIFLAVDGGVNVRNIAEIVEAGANFCVVGSGLFAADSYQHRVARLKTKFTNFPIK